MVSNYRSSHCLYRILGVAGGIALVGEGEHAQIIVTIAETDNPGFRISSGSPGFCSRWLLIRLPKKLGPPAWFGKVFDMGVLSTLNPFIMVNGRGDVTR